MGLEDLTNQAQDAINSEQAEGVSDNAFDKASDFANEKTGGQFEDQVEQGRDFADGQVGNE